jgi:hypothetical protein
VNTSSGEDDGALAVARGLVTKTQDLFDRERHAATIAASDQVFTQFAGRAEPELRERVAYALLLSGHSLEKLGRQDDAIGDRSLLMWIAKLNRPTSSDPPEPGSGLANSAPPGPRFWM